MNREKKLQVRDLTISFRTVNGKVQAVRDISFDLYKGETLAIVGESGSGKSATCKTILGISAASAIIEGGEVLYDGKDLLKISEDDFHAIRGDKIAMVFQDPLSSLNPIMRVGKQLTEAMLLKNKANRRECKAKLTKTIKELDGAMKGAGCSFDSSRFSDFRKVIRQQCAKEAPYDTAFSNATAGLKASEDMLLGIEKDALTDPIADATELRNYALGSIDKFVVDDGEKLKSIAGKLISQARQGAKSKDFAELKASAESLRELLSAGIEKEEPDFFDLGCMEVLGDGKTAYMDSFTADTKAALRFSANRSAEHIKTAVKALEEAVGFFAEKMPDKVSAEKKASELSATVESCIDPLETVKDSLAYTFTVSITNAVSVYYNGAKANVAEQKRFDKQTAKYERLEARGKAPEGKVAPLALVDLDVARENILNIINNMKDQFEKKLTAIAANDYNALYTSFMKWLKETAIGEVHKITQSMAKDTAIRIMEQVGIPEARKRYRQYPFEFSGGMRQRIVIAISLTADPDILICDEPTTALDVTIQAQILELINNLKKERDLSVIFITHDLGVVANMADRVAVMYAGKIVEYGKSEEVFYHPAHPYTWALLASIPDLDSKGEKLEAIPGTPPNMIYPPKGDAFAARNKYALEVDFELQPPMFRISDTHYAATWLLHPDAPKVEMPAIVKDRIARMSKAGGRNNE